MAHWCGKVLWVSLFGTFGLLVVIETLTLLKGQALSRDVDNRFQNYDTHAHRTFTELAQAMYVSLTAQIGTLSSMVQNYIELLKSPPKGNITMPRVHINFTSRQQPSTV